MPFPSASRVRVFPVDSENLEAGRVGSTFHKPFPIRANALQIPEDFPPQKGAKKRKKEGFTGQVARILEQRINGDPEKL